MNELMTPGEFASHRNVTPGRVSQWLNGKGDKPPALHGAAIVQQGGKRLINVREADRQLGFVLDQGQLLGRMTASAQPPGDLPARAPSPEEEHALRYQKARADTAEIDAERARRRELQERGITVEAKAAQAAWAKELTDLLAGMDLYWRELAQQILAAGPMDERAMTMLLRNAFRAFRSKRSDLARGAADAMPSLVRETQDDAPG